MKLLNSMKYAFYIMRHPFDGFWCLKSEKRGTLQSAGAWMALFFLTFTIRLYGTDEIISSVSPENFSVWLLLLTVAGIYFLFCVSNWSLTSLMNGSGTFKEIMIYSAYALVPLTLINIPVAIISHFITLEEVALYNVINVFVVIWVVFLLLAGNLSTHDYSMLKSVVTAVLTVLIMMIIVALGILFFNLIQQVCMFFVSIYRELVFRL